MSGPVLETKVCGDMSATSRDSCSGHSSRPSRIPSEVPDKKHRQETGASPAWCHSVTSCKTAKSPSIQQPIYIWNGPCLTLYGMRQRQWQGPDSCIPHWLKTYPVRCLLCEKTGLKEQDQVQGKLLRGPSVRISLNTRVRARDTRAWNSAHPEARHNSHRGTSEERSEQQTQHPLDLNIRIR